MTQTQIENLQAILKTVRNAAKLNQEEFAKLIGVHRVTFSQIETFRNDLTPYHAVSIMALLIHMSEENKIIKTVISNMELPTARSELYGL